MTDISARKEKLTIYLGEKIQTSRPKNKKKTSKASKPCNLNGKEAKKRKRTGGRLSAPQHDHQGINRNSKVS
jgi:hypothetical protein